MNFDIKEALDAIFYKKDYKPPDDYNQFAINQVLGRYKSYVPILSAILPLSLPNQAHFDYLKKMSGYGKPSYVELKPVEKDSMIKYVMSYYKCSRLDAKDYLMFMSEQEKQSIKEYYEGE